MVTNYRDQIVSEFISRKDLKFSNTDVLIFVPVHNEKDSIAKVVRGIRENCRFDILVIDDGSNDTTPLILNNLGVEVLRHPKPMGTHRILNGLKIALAMGYKYVVKIDGDGQHDPRDIKRLYEHAVFNGTDLVIGSRHFHKFQANVWTPDGSGMWFCSRLVSAVSRKRITDSTSGLKIWSRKACEVSGKAANAGKLKDASTYHIEELVIATRQKLKVDEISVQMSPRQFGETKSFSPRKKLLFPLKLVVSTIRALV